VTTAPYVELGFNPTGLRPQDIPRAGEFLGSPAEALEAALAVTRAQVVTELRQQMTGIDEPTRAQLLRLADLAWQAAFWRYRKISAPIMADAYLRAYRMADAGDVPMSMIYDLADKHAEKVGEYFHASSREALAEGYNTLVNRRVPAKAAVDTVLDAYGLTSRQMRSYVGASKFSTPVSDVLPRSVKARARDFIDKAFTTRIRKMSAQEEHNIDEQAKQLAWMWLQDKGRLGGKAQKMWLTAKDERTCTICAPLHGKKVGLNERFVTKEGEFWTPGLHPNCRCEVRLIENKFTKSLAGAELHEFNQLHPRAEHGRFGTKARTRQTKTIDVDQAFRQIVAQPVRQPTRHLTYVAAAETVEPDTETDRAFAELVSAQPQTRGFHTGFSSPLERRTFAQQAVTHVADPEAKIDFAADLAVELRQQTRLNVQTQPRQLTKTPIQKVQPGYAVVAYHDLGDGDISELRLNHGITFTTDEISAAAEAAEAIQHQMYRSIDDMIDKGAVIEETDKRTGQRYRAELSPRQIEAVAEWYANSATRHWHEDYDPNFVGDEQIRVNWEGGQGYEGMPDRVPLSYIGEKFGLRSEDFEHYVVQVDAVPTEEGAVEHISGGPRSRHQSYSIDGDYELTPGSVSRVVHDDGYMVTTFKVEPRQSVDLPEEGE
jgi:hypothetical protein